MTYPDDWTLNLGHLAEQSACDGRTALRSAFKELETAGLASLETAQADNGTMQGKRWVIYEVSDLNPNRHAGCADVGETRTTESSDDGEARTSGDRTLRSKDAAGSKEGGRKKEQHAGPRVVSSGDGAARPLKDVLPATSSEGTGLDAVVALLTTRGVDKPVALRLAKSHDAERITALIQRFDAENDRCRRKPLARMAGCCHPRGLCRTYTRNAPRKAAYLRPGPRCLQSYDRRRPNSAF